MKGPTAPVVVFSSLFAYVHETYLLLSVTPFIRSQYAGKTEKQTNRQTNKQANTGVVYYIASSLLLMNDAETQFSSLF